MRVSLKQIGRWGLLLAGTAALWSIGPIWKGVWQSQPAFAQNQIDGIGKHVALESYYDVASSQSVSAGGYGGPGHLSVRRHSRA